MQERKFIIQESLLAELITYLTKASVPLGRTASDVMLLASRAQQLKEYNEQFDTVSKEVHKKKGE